MILDLSGHTAEASQMDAGECVSAYPSFMTICTKAVRRFMFTCQNRAFLHMPTLSAPVPLYEFTTQCVSFGTLTCLYIKKISSTFCELMYVAYVYTGMSLNWLIWPVPPQSCRISSQETYTLWLLSLYYGKNLS